MADDVPVNGDAVDAADPNGDVVAPEDRSMQSNRLKLKIQILHLLLQGRY